MPVTYNIVTEQQVVDAIAALEDGQGAGKKFVAGSIALDGSGATTVDLSAELASIDFASLTLLLGTAPGDSTSVLTYTVVTDTTLSIWPWMPTSGSDPTLAASTGTETVAYLVYGDAA
jgi:hypothetical protein